MRPFHRVPRRNAAAALAVAALTLTAVGGGFPTASAASHGTGVRLFSPDLHPVMTIHNSGQDEWIEFNPAVYLESSLHALEIDVRRPDAQHPITAVVHLGKRTRKLPGRLLNGWNGLKKALTVTWLSPSGTVIKSTKTDWCPNDGTSSRLSPHAATETRFTFFCSSHPFTRGQRWGVDRGWSRQLLAYGIDVPDGLGDHPVLEVSLRHGLAKAFGIPDTQRTLRFAVTVKHVTDPVDPCLDGCGPVPGGGKQVAAPLVGSASARAGQRAPAAPRTDAGRRHLSRNVLPDLVALPAWGIFTHVEDGRDELDFAATVYNGGRGPLVAEGFRQGRKPVMDAYQFFYRKGRQVASTRVGTMEYDARPSHQHWHFEDFAVYDLVNAQKHRLRTSGKEAFCLAPTDAIDLLIPGAMVNPGNGDLSTACGDISSIWVREVLAAGWGDTYTQARAGQSIDITGLPNGTYWIRVSANPLRRLHEASRKNNTSLRRIIIGGAPGARTVQVPAYGLIDSEAGIDWSGGPGPVG